MTPLIEVQSRAIGIIERANPDKPELWALEQWDRCVGNMEVPATASVALEIIKGVFDIPVVALCESCVQDGIQNGSICPDTACSEVEYFTVPMAECEDCLLGDL
jgi:hypothetical protein